MLMLTDPQSNFFSFSCSFWGCATQPATASSFGSPVIIPLYHGHCIVSNRESKPKYAHLSMNVKVSKVFNETVSLEDTVIGLHTLQLQLVIFGEGVYSWLLKTQSPKFWPTFHFQVGGGFLATQNSQVLANFSFLRGRGIPGYSKLKVQTPGQLLIRGGGLVLVTQNSKVPTPGQLFIGGGGVFLASQELVLL